MERVLSEHHIDRDGNREEQRRRGLEPQELADGRPLTGVGQRGAEPAGCRTPAGWSGWERAGGGESQRNQYEKSAVREQRGGGTPGDDDRSAQGGAGHEADREGRVG